jgi:hypothetical protein
VDRCDEHLRCMAAELAQPGVEFGGPVHLLGGVEDLPALLGGPDDAEATSPWGPGVPGRCRSFSRADSRARHVPSLVGICLVGVCLVGKRLVGSRLNWGV